VISAEFPAELRPLDAELRRHGFDVKLKRPPVKGVYGLYQPKKRRLWVAPITRDLGIFRQTYLHEAVHAAQSCPNGRLSLLGVTTQLKPVIRLRVQQMLYSHYSHRQSALEREAFEIQGRPDAVSLLISQLRQRCL
tara:strand:- start:60 stop:467 length:408 start_codon:yes stop_codon:yes gene_type:complete